MNDLREYISNEITEMVSKASFQTTYRPPLVGFADANHPLFRDLKTLINDEHLLPSDLLANAKTVVSFFLPFSEEIVLNNQQDAITAKEWAQAKKDTTDLIPAIIDHLTRQLELRGINTSENPAKEPYDRVRFVHRWSQRHVAYICGLGNFGLNHMLITERGCAGRLGSVVIDAETAYNAIIETPFCVYKVNKTCGRCVERCPSHALSYEGIHKPTCSQWINAIAEKYFDGVPALRSCGKCITLPCALKKP